MELCIIVCIICYLCALFFITVQCYIYRVLFQINQLLLLCLVVIFQLYIMIYFNNYH